MPKFVYIAPPKGGITYVGVTPLGTNQPTTIDFGSVSIGTATADRIVLVGISVVINSGAGGTITGVNIGGSAATILGQVTQASASEHIITVIAARAISTGTTATVTATKSNASTTLREACHVAITDNIPSVAAFDVVTNTTDPLTGSLDIPAGGIAFGVTGAHNSSSPGSCTWTNMTEQDDGVVESAMGYSCATKEVDAAETTSITANWSGSTLAATGVFISMEP